MEEEVVMMQIESSVYKVPNVPAVYALFGGQGRRFYVAYVGAADALKTRLIQHFVRRDSSVTTRTSAVGLNPDFVSEVRWWRHQDFSDRIVLTAAELVAFDILDPALRSRGAISAKAKALYAKEAFRQRMRSLFEGGPGGRLIIPNLQDALRRIADLEAKVSEMDARQKSLADLPRRLIRRSRP